MSDAGSLIRRCSDEVRASPTSRVARRVDARADVAFYLDIQSPTGSTKAARAPATLSAGSGSVLKVFLPGDGFRNGLTDDEPLAVLMTAGGDIHATLHAATSTLSIEGAPEIEEDLCIVLTSTGSTRIHTCTPKEPRSQFVGLAPGRWLVAIFFTRTAEALLEEADRLYFSGEHASALVVVENALARRSDCPQAWRRKAYVLRALSRSRDALAAAMRAVRLDPTYALGWRCRGALLRDKNRHLEALDCYRRSLALDPTDFLCWENNANALRALGRSDEAASATAEAARIKARYPDPRL